MVVVSFIFFFSLQREIGVIEPTQVERRARRLARPPVEYIRMQWRGFLQWRVPGETLAVCRDVRHR